MSGESFPVQELSAALAEEQALYGRMLEIARRQEAAATDGDAQTLTEILAARGALMEELERALPRGEALKKAWPAARDRVAEAPRSEVDAALDGLGQLLKEIMAVDDATRSMIEGKEEQVKKALRQLTGARQAARAYRPGTPPDSRFTDTRQ